MIKTRLPATGPTWLPDYDRSLRVNYAPQQSPRFTGVVSSEGSSAGFSIAERDGGDSFVIYMQSDALRWYSTADEADRAVLTKTGGFSATGWIKTASYTVATLPSAATAGAGAMIHVSDESGGAVIAFCDGTNWRRVTDRAVVA